MEAIKKYYRAQRPADYNAELWDNAIDLLLADNPDSREVGRTILEANGADMLVADCFIVIVNGDSYMNKNLIIHPNFGRIKVLKGTKAVFNVSFYKDMYNYARHEHDEQLNLFLRIRFTIQKLIDLISEIKTALGLQ